MMLEVRDLFVSTKKNDSTKVANPKNGEHMQILNGIDLKLEKAQVYALMGRNGSGKSTLASVLMGNPNYQIMRGEVFFEGNAITKITPDKRSRKGIFLSFQHPLEIPGVRINSYLRMIYNNSRDEKISPVRFRKVIEPYLELLNLDKSYLSRYLNEGFSGGEKKKMEMLQMLVLEPKLAILDEIDSGLDVDAIKAVSKAVNYLNESCETTFLLITHYSRILKYIKPEKVFIMENGKIVREGPADLAFEIEEMGYESEDE